MLPDQPAIAVFPRQRTKALVFLILSLGCVAVGAVYGSALGAVAVGCGTFGVLVGLLHGAWPGPAITASGAGISVGWFAAWRPFAPAVFIEASDILRVVVESRTMDLRVLTPQEPSTTWLVVIQRRSTSKPVLVGHQEERQVRSFVKRVSELLAAGETGAQEADPPAAPSASA